jgi:uncharacterized membrane protein YkvA (DUF1232 family)
MANPTKSTGMLSDIVGNARLAWKLFRDPRVSRATKFLIPGIAVAYLLLPIDILPDFIPVLGQLDDLAVIALAIKFFIDMSPSWLVQYYRDEMAGKPSTATDPKAPKREKTVDGEYRVMD